MHGTMKFIFHLEYENDIRAILVNTSQYSENGKLQTFCNLKMELIVLLSEYEVWSRVLSRSNLVKYWGLSLRPCPAIAFYRSHLMVLQHGEGMV
mgnify:CR=1 FL=1